VLLLESEQLFHLDAQDFCELFQPRDRRGIHATLDQADEFNGATDGFGELLLGELPRPSEVSDMLAEFLLKHAV